MSGEFREQVSQRAFEIWEQEGRPEGRDLEHWLAAEAELRPASIVFPAPEKKAAAPKKPAAAKKPAEAPKPKAKPKAKADA
jgi:hypothetical protein